MLLRFADTLKSQLAISWASCMLKFVTGHF
jgi:hypothetical protein